MAELRQKRGIAVMSVERKFWSIRQAQWPQVIIAVQRAVLPMTRPMESASANVLRTLQQRSLVETKSVILRVIVMKAIRGMKVLAHVKRQGAVAQQVRLVTRLARQAVQLRAEVVIHARVARAPAQHRDTHLRRVCVQTVIARSATRSYCTAQHRPTLQSRPIIWLLSRQIQLT